MNTQKQMDEDGDSDRGGEERSGKRRQTNKERKEKFSETKQDVCEKTEERRADRVVAKCTLEFLLTTGENKVTPYLPRKYLL